jgi:hypothetical protein
MSVAKVENMVCSLCSRRHGQEHHECCPKVYGGPEPQGYEAGYRAARHLAVEVAESSRFRLQRAVHDVQALHVCDQTMQLLRIALAAEGMSIDAPSGERL